MWALDIGSSLNLERPTSWKARDWEWWEGSMPWQAALLNSECLASKSGFYSCPSALSPNLCEVQMWATADVIGSRVIFRMDIGF